MNNKWSRCYNSLFPPTLDDSCYISHAMTSMIARTGMFPENLDLVINYGEGGGCYKMGKSWVRDRVKRFVPPLFRLETFCATHPPPPLSAWLKLQAHALKLPKSFFSLPSAWLKLFPPLFSRGIT